MLDLLAQTLPEDWFDVVIVPVLLAFAALFVYFLGWNQERHGRRAPWKWLSLAFVGLGIWVGVRDVQVVQDPFVQSLWRGQRKLLYSHYLSLALPIATAVALVVWHLVGKLAKRSEQA